MRSLCGIFAWYSLHLPPKSSSYGTRREGEGEGGVEREEVGRECFPSPHSKEGTVDGEERSRDDKEEVRCKREEGRRRRKCKRGK